MGGVLAFDLPKKPVEVKEDVPKEGAPNFGALDGVSLLGGVAVDAPKDEDPKTDACVVEVVPGFWKKSEEDDAVLLAPNAPKPGCRLLKPVLDVFSPPKAPPPNAPPEGVAAGVVDVGIVEGVDVSPAGSDLAGGVAGGVETGGVGFSGDVVGVVVSTAEAVDKGTGCSLAPNALGEPVADPNPNVDFVCSSGVLASELEVAQTDFASLD